MRRQSETTTARFSTTEKDGAPKRCRAALTTAVQMTLQARGAKNKNAQPARKHSPPSGVIAPSQRRLVNVIVYKLPLKRRMPAQNNQAAPRLVAPNKASTKRAMLWMK